MKRSLFFLCMVLLVQHTFSQTNFSFSGYTAGQNFTSNSYSFLNTPIAGCVTMTTRITQSSNPGWWNLTGANPPNYATYSPGTCSPITGLYMVTDRVSTSPIVTMELTFSAPVCGPLTFTIADINGANLSFRDDVTISAWDQNNIAIPLTTAMVINNGSGNCNGGAYGTYTHVTGNSLKVVGCSYDDCALDYFTIYSSTKMISRVTIDYASGNADWNGSVITNPDRQWIIVNNVRAYTPCFNLSSACGPPVSVTATQLSGFPPTSGTGLPAGYPNPSISAPTAPTYAWTTNAGSLSVTNPPSLPSTTNVSGLTASGATITMTGQNNKGCIATKSLLVDNSLCITLPIELLTFEGICFDGERNFYWSTSSEKDNDYFVIQQSKDGISFIDVEKIQGAGTSNELNTYFGQIQNNNGDYFRLKQVDFNGRISLSDPIYTECNFEIKENFIIVPNPIEGDYQIQFNAKRSSVVQITIKDLNGNLLDLNTREVTQGLNKIDAKLHSKISSGIYFVTLIDEVNHIHQTMKVIKK